MSTRDLILIGYALSLIGIFLAWLAGRRMPHRLASAGNLLAHMMQTRSTRFGLLVVWWWLGWHYLASD